MRQDEVIFQIHDNTIIVDHRKVINVPPNNTLGQGVTIAIIDTGIFDTKNSDIVHALTPDTIERFKDVKFPEILTDGDHHVNFIASIIAGQNGIAPNVKLEVYTVKGITDEEIIKSTAIFIREAINSKVNLINLSIGWGHIGEDFPYEITTALYEARDNGIGVLLAASNENNPLCGTKGNVILGEQMYKNLGEVLENMNNYMRVCTASSYHKSLNVDILFKNEYREEIAGFSNLLNPVCAKYGVAAPGRNILAYGIDKTPKINDGTSFSTPMVTAATAAIMGDTGVNANEALCIVDKSARKIKYNVRTEEEYREEYCKSEENNLRFGGYGSFIKWASSRKYGRGGMIVRYRDKTFTPYFEEYTREKYSTQIVLDEQQFGQGVIDLNKAYDSIGFNIS